MLKRRDNVSERDVSNFEHDKEMVQHVGRLGLDRARIRAHGGYDQFHSFFTKFSRASFSSSVEQLTRVGRIIGGGAARVDGGGEPIEGVAKFGNRCLSFHGD
jgi:hypothetical protein